jgi:hypothetical protein
LDGVGIVLSQDAHGGGEIDCGDGFGEAVAGFDEVLVAECRAFVRQPFGEAEKAALGSSCGLIAKLAVADFGRGHESSELAGGEVNVQLLEGKKILSFHVDLLAAPARST